MDYDDNEFQSQNLQLAGEGSAKFPPVFHPYALPKFDFDDSVQGHLRFDSLVETEVFLGIESNEDNQWIEDYSRGGGGIEFRASAAESCTISRHNNVWSEATSSESVEMLLKSVGQDENITEKLTVKESDACDELGCLVRQMESGSKHKATLSKAGEVGDVCPTLTPGEILGKISLLKEDLVGKKPPIAVTSPKNESISVDAGSSDPILDAAPVTGSFPLAVSCSVVVQRPENSLVEPPTDRTEEDCSAAEMLVESKVISAQNIRSGEMNKQDTSHNKSDIGDSEVVLQTKSSEQGDRSHQAQEAEMTNQILERNVVDSGTPLWGTPISLRRLESVKETIKVEASAGGMGQPSNSIQEDFGLHRVEGQNENVQGGDSENLVSLNDFKFAESSNVDKHDSLPESFENDSGCGTDGLDDPEAPLLHQEDNKLGKGEGDGSSSNHSGCDATLNVECSVETNLPLTSEVIKDASDICRVESNADMNISPSTLKRQTWLHEEHLLSEQIDSHSLNQQASVDVKESTVLQSDSSNVENKLGKHLVTDKGIDSSYLSEVSTLNELVNPNSGSDVTGGVESAVHNNKLVSYETAAVVDSLSQNVIDANSAFSHDEDQATNGSKQETQSSQHREMPNGINQERTVGTEECPLVTCSIRGQSDGCEAHVISEVHEEPNIKENCEKTSSKSSDGESILKSNDILSPPLRTEQLQCDNSQKSGKDNKAVLGSEEKKFEQIAVPSVTVVQAGSISSIHCSGPDAKSPTFESGNSCTSLDKPSCGSPTVIRASESSVHSEKQEAKGSDRNNLISKIGEGNAHHISSVSPDTKANYTIEGEQSFTFVVNATSSKKETGKNLQSLSAKEASKASSTVEVSPPSSGFSQLNPWIAQDVFHGVQQVANRENVRSGSKSTSERKRRASNKAAGKEAAKKGNSVKDTAPARQSDKGDKTNIISLNSSGIFQLPHSSDSLQQGHPFGVLSTSTSTLPDLNTSSSAVFQQPFTDLQQVQLRAQIFVYGALIQGTAPDEAYMISAFGGLDGGRSIWETPWRMCAERLRGQKSILDDAETPLQSRPVARATDQAMKNGPVQAKISSSPLGRASSKSSTPPVVNTVVPISSPLWSIPTPSTSALQSTGMARGAVIDYQQAISPMHTHQTTPVRSFVGHNTSWMSQAPFRGTWVASPPTSAFDLSARFPALPIAEPVQLTPVKEPSVVHSSGAKQVGVGPSIQNLSSPTVFPATSSTLESKKVTVSSGQPPTESKSRKRKKVPVSDGSGKVTLLPQSQAELVSTPTATSHMPLSPAITTPASSMSKAPMEKVIIPVSSATSTDHLKNSDKERCQRVALAEETLDKLKEARTQAEDAAAVAAAAVGHSQEIWNQLDKHKVSGMEPDVETKLASAAMAIAAAAAVAKAAAAAAHVASSAALQAKLMADEVLNSNGPGNSGQDNETSLPDSVKILGNATPASILKGENAIRGSSSIIVAAKEAARRKVEAASAASKRAENMDAIVKAAELAAEAVSQAGKIVAMGDPLPLSELIEASMGGYWRDPQASTQPLMKTSGMSSEKMSIDSVRVGLNTSAKHPEEFPIDREMHTTKGKSPITRETSRDSLEDNVRLGDGTSNTVAASGKNTKGNKGSKTSELAKTIGVPDPETGSGSVSMSIQISLEKEAQPLEGNGIKEGSCVEVFKEGEQLKAAWFPAKVLSLKDEKAYVCFTELPSNAGHDKLKEWVALKGEENNAPKIRIARPFTAMPFEGTRKRRRAAMGEYSWSVGDRVDAWMGDSWWEGVVSERNKKDETLYTVHFQAQGETSAIRAWHLRPSLVWKNGEWVEWSNSIEVNLASHEADAPQEKRLRLHSPVVEVKEKDKMLKSTEVIDSGKSNEPRLLDLSESEGIFNMGRSGRDENRPVGARVIRTGLQKEGSKVVFGVPRPGKKRKFMDVSKHYNRDQGSKISEANDSSKLSKYLMPQGQASGSRSWKTFSRNDPKEKRAAVSKPKIPKSGKPLNIPGRTIAQKNNLVGSTVSAPDDDGRDTMANSENSGNNAEDTSGKDNQREFRPLSRADGAAEGPIVFSSMPHVQSKKGAVPNPKADRLTKGRLAPAGGKSTKAEEVKVFNSNSSKSTSEVVEPRRSNRRIQPTSRLLEGLQSSLIISKIPSASHDKSHKSQSRGASRG